jgi:MFS family permease
VGVTGRTRGTGSRPPADGRSGVIPGTWGTLPPQVWRLLSVRTLRSFSQGYLNVVAPLYLLSLGVSAVGLGALFTASFVIGAVLTVIVGVLADRIGRKPFLIAFSILIFAWGAIYATTTALPFLLTVSAIAGIDRGGGNVAGGQAGPFAPAESAVLADLVPADRRHEVFSGNAFLATVAAAAGTAVSGLPFWLRGTHVAFLASDRLLFAGTALVGLASTILLLGLPEPLNRTRALRTTLLTRPATAIVVRQSLAAACNSLGVGFVSSMLVVWFNLRFHVGAASIGPMLTASYVLTAIGFLTVAPLARRLGSVRMIVATRVLAAGLVVLIAVSPTFLIAAALQVLRQVVTQMVTPVRQSFTMGLVASDERASVSGITGLVRRLSAAASPSISGALMGEGALELPFFLAGALQVVSAAMYYWFFAKLDDRAVAPTVVVETPAADPR